MRLGSHAVVAGAVMGVLLPWTPAGWVGMALGVLGSQFPDWVEVRLLPLLTFGRVRVGFSDTVRERGVWYVRHRGVFHDFMLYAVLWVALFTVDFLLPRHLEVGGIPVWVSMLPMGALCHVVCDMGSASGVPVLGVNVALRWYRVGSLSELFAVMNICGACAVVYLLRERWGVLVRFWGDVVGNMWWFGVVGFAVVVVGGLWFVGRGIRFRWFNRVGVDESGPIERVLMWDLTKHYRRGPGRRPEEIEVLKVAEGEGSVEVPSGVWRHGELVEFWREVSGIVDAGARGVLEKIFDILDAHGDVCSVHGEDRGYGGTYDVLSRVSVVEHSVHVARVGLRILQRQYPDTYRRYVPGVLYSCVLHDIGKVDALMGRHEGEAYCRGDHALDGATYVLELLTDLGVDDALRKDVADAVREHHSGRKEDDLRLLTAVLVKADREARREEYEALVAMEVSEGPAEKELEKDEKTDKDRKGVEHGEGVKEEKEHVSGEGIGEGVCRSVDTAACIMDRIAEHASHQDVSRSTRSRVEAVELPEGFGEAVLEALRDVVNSPKEQSRTELNEWRSVSQPDGYVYMKLDFVGEVLREVAVMRKERLYELVSEDEEHMRGRVLGWCNWLRDRGWLHPLIRPGFFSQRFKVRDRSTRREFVVSLVSVKIDAFGLRVSEAEEDRRRYPRLRELVVLGVPTSSEEQVKGEVNGQ